ncbi:Uncharacterized protein family UPF0503 [Cynara cardunculus var. scolymus]|uniref:Uncharacterized protein family UPF0503 n=1 Tax=Cynara cardunculus var. scolymus TaxID=59895 RepID=A0A103XQ85_CYNCS|nr:Uncharacterized protein family UPF0503 [Cynara cardunculus var. scolymus]
MEKKTLENSVHFTTQPLPQPPVMNPTAIADQPPPVLPLQPPRSSFSCDRHPDENFTGFCPSCLCERLTTLDQSANAAPQRKSCDVRGRNTLWSLFSIHDDNKPRHSYSQQQILGNNGIVLETNRENEEEDHEEDHEEDPVHNEDNDGDEIRVTEELDVRSVNDLDNNIVEEVAEIDEKEDATVEVLKPMKDHIDLDSQSKKPSLSNLWSAASVLSKKWHKWRRKQKKSGVTSNGVILTATLPPKKPISRKYRETQSEIADYGFGRRSCDTDPRFSLDAGRMSFDDPRYSFDEPRASWDGYLIGRTFPRLPPMVEDVPVVHVPRCDTQIPVEDPSMADDNIPGGSTQTREYYLDSSSKRRKSLDRSNSIRKMAAAVVAELDETKVTPIVSNAKVSPATIDNNPVHGSSKFASVTFDNEPPRVSASNSLRDDCSETFELGFRDNGIGTAIGLEKKEMKKSRRWSWKIWGFIHRRNSGNKDDDEDRCSSVNGVGRSYSESWQDLRGEGNNEANGGINKKIFRSNSSVSWRSSSYNTRKSNSKMNGKIMGNEQGFGNGKNKRNGEEFVLERNRSARYSPTHIDNGLLRFYLAPMSGSRRGGIGITSRPTTNSHSISRSMLGLY